MTQRIARDVMAWSERNFDTRPYVEAPITYSRLLEFLSAKQVRSAWRFRAQAGGAREINTRMRARAGGGRQASERAVSFGRPLRQRGVACVALRWPLLSSRVCA